MLLDKPIFIVGAPRSGTTLLYDLMASHKDLAWFSQHDIAETFTIDFLQYLHIRRRIFNIRHWPYAKDGFESRFRTTYETPFEVSYVWNQVIPKVWVNENDVGE